MRPTPPELVDWTLVSAGYALTCGIDSQRSLWCWGCDHIGEETSHHVPFPVDPGTTWSHVSAGTGNGCAIRTDGRLFCWGGNDYGEVGDGTTEERRELTEVQGEHQWRDVMAAGPFVCGIRLDGELYCWGANSYGLFGTPDRGPVTTPRAVLSGASWQDVSAGSDNMCAVRTDGTLWCWSRSADGEPAEPEQLGSDADWASVALGLEVSCALKEDGSAWCWGQPPVGDGTFRDAEAPVRVVGDQRWLSISAGYLRACGVREDGETLCWGRNEEGALGLGEPQPDFGDVVQVRNPDGLGWRYVNQGQYGHQAIACAIDHYGSLWCWGELLSSLPYAEPRPAGFVASPIRIGEHRDWKTLADPVSGVDGTYICGIREGDRIQCLGDWEAVADGWTAVTASKAQACALDQAGCVSCWGAWLYEYGTPEYPEQELVVRDFPGVELGCGFSQLDQGPWRGCGVASDGRVDCWSIAATDHDALAVTHTAPLPGTSWESVSVGHHHVCALDRTGALWCQGDNSRGQLGIGRATAPSQGPGRVGAEEDMHWTSVHAGGKSTCAVTPAGELWCWGDTYYGGLEPYVGGAARPVRLGEESDWASVSVGSIAECGIRSSGALFCWGENGWGLLGDEGNWFRAEPAPVAFPAPER